MTDAPVDGALSGGADVSRLDALVREVHSLLTDRLQIDAPTPDTDIIESGALDSFMMVEILVSLEEQFGAEVALEELEADNFRSARSIALLVIASPAR